MSGYVSTELRQLVVERANGRCEYCLLHQRDAALFDHEIDHIIAEKKTWNYQPNLPIFKNETIQPPIL